MASVNSLNRLYQVFFLIHLPIIFAVDTLPLWPAVLVPGALEHVRRFYVDSFRDKFFDHAHPTPAWFTLFLWMELIYHAPLSLWAIGALSRDDPMVPVHLLVFGVQSLVTSLACLVEVWSWPDRSVLEKQTLTALYGPYVALGAVMAVDMFSRLRRLRIKRD